METKNYIYFVQEIHKNRNRGFSFFKNHDEMSDYICKQMPTLVDENELEDETRTKYIVTRIIEDEKEKITYNNIDRIADNGRIEWVQEYNEDDEVYIQPTFIYEAEDKDYKQKYSEFYYTKKDGKFIDYIDEYETLEEMASDYFSNQTL